MMREWNFRLLLAFLTLASLPLQAADTTTGVSYTIHHHYVAPRALGMGDAFVAVSNDYNALFYNPAGLARREDGEINLYIDAGLSTNIMKAQKEINEASNSEGNESTDLEKTMEVLESYYGKAMSVRFAPANAIWVRPHWGIGFIPADVSLEMTMHQNVGPAMNLTVYGDTTAALGYGDDFHGLSIGRLSWGVTGKFVNRAYFSKTVTALELAADSNLVKKSDLQEGYTMDADVGFLFTPALPADGVLSWLRLARPTFGAVIRNVGETGFKNSLKVVNKDAVGEPEKLYRVLDVGTKWEYPDVWIFGGRGTLDIRDIGHPMWNVRKGTHVGFEFDWTMASWWKGAYRFGLNQGYLTYGASAMFSIFNIDLVSYAEDVGTYNLPVENRIYMVRLNMNF
jgi:hypothetical protein